VITLLAALLLLVDEIPLFPVAPVPVVPAPVVPPVTDPSDVAQPVATVSSEEVYVLQSATEVVIVTSPPGLVEVTHELGPLIARGRWAGGGGKVETRLLEAGHLYFVDARQPGKTELIVIPIGMTDASQIQRQLVTVQLGPQPPPKPKPDPDPVDDDQIPVDDTKGFRVLLLLDETADPATLAAVNSLQTRRWLDDQTDDWRRWDRSTVEADDMDDEEPVWREIWRAAEPELPAGPQLLVIKGKTITVRPLTSQVVQELEAMR
jgi:hypothetical protein